jgi:phage-related protein
MPDEPFQQQHRWRFYRTASGHAPAKEFILRLPLADQAAVFAAMKDTERGGLKVTRHLRGDVYEVRAHGPTQGYRILFATEGHHRQILLALEAFSKKTQKTPPQEIAIAEARLTDWRQRGKQP